MLDLEDQVSRYAHHLDRRYPDVTFEEVVDRTLQPTFLGPLPVRRRGLVIALAVAAIVLVVVGGVAFFSGMLTPDPSPVVTFPEESPETTVVDPPEVEVGDQQAFDTSLGTWVWSRVDTMSDQVDEADAYRSASMLPEVPLPNIDGMSEWWRHLDWLERGASSASLGDVTITAAAVRGHVDWGRLYSSGGEWVQGIWQSMDCRAESAPACPEQYSILELSFHRNQYPNEVIAVLEASVLAGDPEAVEFRDQDTGELVLRLQATDEVSAEMLLRAAECHFFRCGVSVWKVYVDGDDPGWVDPPWLGIPVEAVAITVTRDGFVMVGIEWGHASQTLYTWGSSDGVTWEELKASQHIEALSGLHDTPRLHLGGERGLPMLVVSAAGLSRVWTSTDGSSWQPTQVDVSQIDAESFDALAMTKSGWVVLAHGKTVTGKRCEVWISADGVNWKQIPRPAETRRANSSQCSIVDDDTVELISGHVPFVEPRESYKTIWRGTFGE